MFHGFDPDLVKGLWVRGMRVGDEVPLTALKNVGKMRALRCERPPWLGTSTIGARALAMLEEDPLEEWRAGVTRWCIPPRSLRFVRMRRGCV